MYREFDEVPDPAEPPLPSSGPSSLVARPLHNNSSSNTRSSTQPSTLRLPNMNGSITNNTSGNTSNMQSAHQTFDAFDDNEDSDATTYGGGGAGGAQQRPQALPFGVRYGRDKSTMRLPLFAGFVPQLLLMAISSAVLIVVFIIVCQEATDSAITASLKENIKALELQVSSGFVSAFHDAQRLANLAVADDALLVDHFASYSADFSNRTRFRSFWQAAKAALHGAGGNKYSAVYQTAAHPESSSSSSTPKWSVSGCSQFSCGGAIAKPGGTFDFGFFDGSWLPKYPSPSSSTDLGITEVRSPFEYNDFQNGGATSSGVKKKGHHTWRLTPAQNYLPFPIQSANVAEYQRVSPPSSWYYSIIFNTTAAADATTGVATSDVAITLPLDILLAESFSTFEIPHSTFAVFDLDAQMLLRYNNSDDLNSSPSPPVNISEMKEASLIRALNTLSGRADNGDLATLSTNQTSIIILDDEDDDNIIAARVTQRGGIRILILIITDRGSHDSSSDHRGTALVLIVISVVLFILALIASAATSLLLKGSIARTARTVHDAARLMAHTEFNDGDPNRRSAFGDIAALQDASIELWIILQIVRGYIPQSVLAESNIRDVTPTSFEPDDPTEASSTERPQQQQHRQQGGPATQHSTTTTAHHPILSINSSMSRTSDLGLSKIGMSVTNTSLGSGSRTNEAFEKSAAAVPNTFRYKSATALFVQLISKAPRANVGFIGLETRSFMESVLPIVLKARGVVEIQRHDFIVAIFDRGVHGERATVCGQRVITTLQNVGLNAVAIVHSGQFLTGSCGAQGCNALVTTSDFFGIVPKIVELSVGVLKSQLLVTERVAKTLPLTLLAIPVDNLAALPALSFLRRSSDSYATSHPSDAANCTVLYEVVRRSSAIVSQLPKVKEVFSLLLKGRYKDASIAGHAALEGGNIVEVLKFPLQRLCVISDAFESKHITARYTRHYASWLHFNYVSDVHEVAVVPHEIRERSESAPTTTTTGGGNSTSMYSGGGGSAQTSGTRAMSIGGQSGGNPLNANPASIMIGEDRHQSASNGAAADEVESSSRRGSTAMMELPSIASANAKEEVQKAIAQYHDGLRFTTGGKSSQSVDGSLDTLAPMESLFSMAVAAPSNNGEEQMSGLEQVTSDPSSTSSMFGLTKSQHNHLATSPGNMTTNVPARCVDIDGQLWVRAPLGSQIGTGASAEVHRGMNLQGDVVALKCIDLEGSMADTAFLKTEVGVLSEIHHPNLASFISVAIHRSMVVLILEYVAGGTLRHVITSYGRALPRTAANRFAVDILHGLHYLHERGIVHGDIKPENVLMGADSVCKITDFGSSVERRLVRERNFNKSQNQNSNLGHMTVAVPSGFGPHAPVPPRAAPSAQQPPPRHEAMEMDIRGTAPYMAPEVARGELPTAASDVWSFGILLHELITGERPWSSAGDNVANNEVKLIRGLAKKRDELGALRPVVSLEQAHSNGKIVSSESKILAAKIIESCFGESPHQRPSLDTLLTCEFFL